MECKKLCNITAGSNDEKEFITYLMGAQVSHSLNTEKAM